MSIKLSTDTAKSLLKQKCNENIKKLMFLRDFTELKDAKYWSDALAEMRKDIHNIQRIMLYINNTNKEQ